MATLGLKEEEKKAIERLKADVIEPSMSALVLLAFQSQRSGPGGDLSSALDKVAASHAGRGVKLVTIDIDRDPMLAAQFQIQSVPTVYAIFRGQPVADLSQFISESQIAKAVEQILRQLGISGTDAAKESEVGPLVDSAEAALDDGDAAQAAALFATAIDVLPDHPGANGGLARALIAAGRTAEARTFLDSLPDAMVGKTEIGRARAALDLAETPKADTAAFEARLAANPDDIDARFELANALMANGERDGAADALLDIIGRDRDWNDGAARQRLLQLIEAQGIADPWSGNQRRRLSAILFT